MRNKTLVRVVTLLLVALMVLTTFARPLLPMQQPCLR